MLRLRGEPEIFRGKIKDIPDTAESKGLEVESATGSQEIITH